MSYFYGTPRTYQATTDNDVQFEISITPNMWNDWDVSVWMRSGKATGILVASMITDLLSSSIEMVGHKLTIKRGTHTWTIVVEHVGGDDSTPQYELHYQANRYGEALQYKIEQSGSYFKLWESAWDHLMTGK